MLDRLLVQMTQMLRNLDAIIDRARAHEEAEGLEPNALAEARLAPDMFDFTRQIQAACDTAKFVAARLSGQTPPHHPDEESSFEELQQRLHAVITYLRGFEADDFQGWEDHKIDLPFAPGQYALGQDYFHQFALPNFYFHVTTAYDILRHEGLEIGKRDYIGHMTMHPHESN